MSTYFIDLMTIMVAGFAVVMFLVWKVVRYIRKHRNILIKSAVVRTEGRILRKFFGGGDSRFSGTPHMTFQITIDEKTFEVDKNVDKEIFFSYEEGDMIDLFVADGEDMLVYPLESLVEKKAPGLEEKADEREPVTA